MKILFLGSFFPECEFETVKLNSKKSVQNASNILQWDYINAFESIYTNQVSLITKMCVGTFPNNYRKMLVKTQDFVSKNGSRGISVGFPNVYPIKQLLYPTICYKYIKKWIMDNKNEEKVLVAYSTLNSMEIIKIRKKYKDIKIVLIIPDLPYYMNLGKNNIIYNLKRHYEMAKLNKCLFDVDVMVPITDYMRNLLDPNHKIKSITIEGMINSQKQMINHQYDAYFKFCYSGTLTEKYGVMNLIDEFRKITNPNARLIICGGGELTKEVENATLKDNRIIYKGIVSSNEAYEIQSQSDVLINPRMNDNEYTKFSFPSKILQYMKTGRPILCYKLDGIPDEYDRYLLYINDKETLKDKMEAIMKMNLNELDKIGKNAKSFVYHQKSNVEQVKKIVKMLGEDNEK